MELESLIFFPYWQEIFIEMYFLCIQDVVCREMLQREFYNNIINMTTLLPGMFQRQNLKSVLTKLNVVAIILMKMIICNTMSKYMNICKNTKTEVKKQEWCFGLTNRNAINITDILLNTQLSAFFGEPLVFV